MINKDFFAALNDLEKEKRIKKEFFIETLEQALAVAYKKQHGVAKAVEVKLNPDRNQIRVIAYQTVVDSIDDAEENIAAEGEEEVKALKKPKYEISLEDARKIKKSAKVGDIISEEISSKDFGRIVAGTARQILSQKLRDEENKIAIDEVAEKQEQLISCVLRRKEEDNFFVEINKIEAILKRGDQMPTDRTTLRVGDKVKVYVKKIVEGKRGPEVAVTRANTGFVRKLFELEVPEIASGIVQIKAIAREAGFRTKIAVVSENPRIDAVGACVGNRGMRVNSIISELYGEKIDIIEWSPDPIEFVRRALSPAIPLNVVPMDEERSALVIVADEKQSLAIGKGGQNAKLAVKLTGWKIDIKPLSETLKLHSEEQEEIEPIETFNEPIELGTDLETDLEIDLDADLEL